MRRSFSRGSLICSSCFLPGGDGFFHAAIEDRMKNLFLAFEVEIDGAVGHAGFAGDVGNFGIEVAVVGKDADGGAQNCFALVGDDGTVGIK